MRPRSHLLLSAAAGGAVWVGTGEPWALPITLGAGVLVDGDHAPDLWWALALKRRPITIIVLHSWECLLSVLAIGIWIGFPWWITAIFVGYSSHLFTDQLFNGNRPWTYFLTFRARRRFRPSEIDPDWYEGRAREKLRKELPFALWLVDWWKAR